MKLRSKVLFQELYLHKDMNYFEIKQKSECTTVYLAKKYQAAPALKRKECPAKLGVTYR